MQIEKSIKLLAAATVLLLTFAQLPAQTAGTENEGDSGEVKQSTSDTPTTSPGKTPAEGRDNTRAEGAGNTEGGDKPITPFTPSETISADSAIAFPVDI